MSRLSKNPEYKGLNVAHRNRIKAFEEAVRAHDNMGAMPPGDHESIENQLDYTREQLVDTILNLYGKNRDDAGRLKRIENLLYDMIMSGGGDRETIKQYAQRINNL